MYLYVDVILSSLHTVRVEGEIVEKWEGSLERARPSGSRIKSTISMSFKGLS